MSRPAAPAYKTRNWSAYNESALNNPSGGHCFAVMGPFALDSRHDQVE